MKNYLGLLKHYNQSEVLTKDQWESFSNFFRKTKKDPKSFDLSQKAIICDGTGWVTRDSGFLFYDPSVHTNVIFFVLYDIWQNGNETQSLRDFRTLLVKWKVQSNLVFPGELWHPFVNFLSNENFFDRYTIFGGLVFTYQGSYFSPFFKRDMHTMLLTLAQPPIWFEVQAWSPVKKDTNPEITFSLKGVFETWRKTCE